VPVVGAILPISVKLPDTNAVQVVRATIRDKDGVEISGSPFTLTHVGLGLYQINTVLMPDTAFVTVSHEIFKGPGFTNKNVNNYLDAAQCFIKDAFSDAIKDIKSAVRGFDLVAEIDEGEVIVAEICEEPELDVTIEVGEELAATIEESETLNANVEDTEILEGDVEC